MHVDDKDNVMQQSQLQQIIQERLRSLIGAQVVQIIALQAQLDEASTELARLRTAAKENPS